MAGDKYLYQNSGVITERAAIQTSAGSGDAGRIPAVNASGVFDNSFMPPGIGADTQVITASEALAAGDFVNVWNSTGAKVRKADATVAGKKAHGFVLASVASSAAATVYFEGTNNALTSLTVGDAYLSTTAGTSQATAPSGSGNVVQPIGVATSATTLNFESGIPIVLA
jgi:hypothetical protein